MTTVACNRSVMACDSLVTNDEVGVGTHLGNKIHRIGKSIFGEAGEDCTGIGRALSWLRKGQKGEPPDPWEDADWRLLELAPDGIYVWGTDMHREPVCEETMAIGSGRKVALYCMRELGMEPDQAVLEASKVDHHTRPPVKAEKLRNS